MLFPAPLTGLDLQSDDESCVLSAVDSYDALLGCLKQKSHDS